MLTGQRFFSLLKMINYCDPRDVHLILLFVIFLLSFCLSFSFTYWKIKWQYWWLTMFEEQHNDALHFIWCLPTVSSTGLIFGDILPSITFRLWQDTHLLAQGTVAEMQLMNSSFLLEKHINEELRWQLAALWYMIKHVFGEFIKY
jgi:hypothetical protein